MQWQTTSEYPLIFNSKSCIVHLPDSKYPDFTDFERVETRRSLQGIPQVAGEREKEPECH